MPPPLQWLSTVSPTIYAALALSIIGLFLLYQWALPKPVPGIPHHKASARRIMGDAPLLLESLKTSKTIFHWIVKQSAVLQSPVYQVMLRPLGKPFVVVLDHREITDILMRRSKEFDRSKTFRDLFVGTIPDHHISLPTNEKFKAQRNLLADTMSNQFLHKVSGPHLYHHFLHLMDLWRLKSDIAQGKPFTAATDIGQSTLDAVWAVTFGKQTNTIPTYKGVLIRDNVKAQVGVDGAARFPEAQMDVDAAAIHLLSEAIEVAVRSIQPRISHWIRRQYRDWKDAKVIEERLLSSALQEAERRMLKPDSTDDTIDCATDHLVLREARAARKENREPIFDTPANRDELLGYLVAGHETSATTMKWGVKMLADHPEAQTSLRQAVYSAFPKDHANNILPSIEDIVTTSVPYLDAVIEEILRLGTTLLGTSRVTLTDVDILGYRVPKGIDVYLLWGGPGYTQSWEFGAPFAEKDRSPSSQAHKDSVVPDWDNVDIAQFKPERWLKVDEKGETAFDGSAGPTRPFGGGIRGCFGRKLAYLELRVFFILLIWEFELQRCPPALSNYEAISRLTYGPTTCYIRPRWLGSKRRQDAGRVAVAPAHSDLSQ